MLSDLRVVSELISDKGATNGGDKSSDPTISSLGVVITYKKYFTFSSYFPQNSKDRTDVLVWIFYLSGQLDQFVGMGLQVSTSHDL